MNKRHLWILLTLCLAALPLHAAGNPFTGKWKLNPARSRLTDVMKVHAVAGNKYDFNLGGDTIETIVVDGTDQPASFNSTLSVTPEAPDHWKVVRKSKGRTEIIGLWKLSADGKTLTDNFTSYRPDGTTFHLDYIYQRTAGGPGFDGTWESTTEDMSSAFEMEIAPRGDNGVLITFPTFNMKKALQFDGKDYSITGGNAPEGYAASAHKIDDHTIELTDKVKDKHLDTQRMEVSSDGKTLTCTITIPTQDKPQIQVFDRE